MWILNKKHILFILLFFVGFQSMVAQPMKADTDYYIFPIKPGVQNTLAGSMGELRSSHFHTGIDIRTGGQSGAAVVAAASGYISRIVVSSAGYGNALYILHPNGHTTVYAHLRDFKKPFADYVRSAQYSQHKHQVNLFPNKNQFYVNQGDTIAHSGNSGSSGGPHLHFDIRDKNHKLLNPLSYGFKEIIDNTPPVIKKLGITTFDKHSRVDNEFGRKEYSTIKSGKNYIITDTIKVFGTVGLDLYAWDRMDNSRFKTGVNEIEVLINDNQHYKQTIDTWSFSHSRSFYQHINYDVLQKRNERVHKLYVEPGNQLKFYKTANKDGLLYFTEDCLYNVTIKLKDSYKNESVLNFIIKCETGNKQISTNKKLKPGWELFNNYLVVHEEISDSVHHSGELNLSDKRTLNIEPDYVVNNSIGVYIWPLANGLPKQLNLCDTVYNFNFIGKAPPAIAYKLYGDSIDLFFARQSLFDSLYVNLEHKIDTATNKEWVKINNPTPIKSNIIVRMTPKIIPQDISKSHIYSMPHKGFIGGTWKDNSISFKTRQLGEFSILTDSVAPTIRTIRLNRDQLSFRLNDNLSGIKSFDLKIDGKWVLLNYDAKIRKIWTEKLDKNQPFKGLALLTITDMAGNVKTFETTIN